MSHIRHILLLLNLWPAAAQSSFPAKDTHCPVKTDLLLPQSAAITIPTPQFHYLSKHAKTSMGLLEEKQQWEQLSLQRCLQETCAVSQPSREGFRILPKHQHSSVALAHTPNLITHTHDFQPATESSNQVAPEPAVLSSSKEAHRLSEVKKMKFWKEPLPHQPALPTKQCGRALVSQGSRWSKKHVISCRLKLFIQAI